MQDTIANALNRIMNAKRARKKTCIVPSSKLLLNVLELMKKGNYIESFSERAGKAEITIGNINECRAIKPRFYVGKDDYDKYVRRYLPARDFGVVIVSTSKGILSHHDAFEKGVGGSLIAFCY
ncbi:MAG: 30S ribosomal protein S8 [archaeon]